MNDTVSSRYLAEPTQFWWSVLLGLLAWLMIVFVFGRIVSPPKDDTTPPLPIDARIIELPESKPLPPIVQAPRVPEPIAKPLPKQVPIQTPKMESPVVDRPIEKTVERPSTQASSEVPPASVDPSPSVSAGTAHMGAKAIYQPLPNIPDDLRDEAIKAVATARFHINPDGTATVELIKPTSNPRINQIILNTLKTWKFFPALQDGKPIQSSQDIKVNVNVS